MNRLLTLAALFASTVATAQTALVTPTTVTTPSFRAQRGSALVSLHADLPGCYNAIVADVLARKASGTYSCRMLGGSSGTARWDFTGTYTPAAPPPPPPPPPPATTTTVEAESGTIAGGANVQTVGGSASGGQIVGLFTPGASLTLPSASGSGALVVRYANQGGTAAAGVYVNGTRQATLQFPSTGSWGTFANSAPITVALTSGVRIQLDSGAADLDTVTLPANGGTAPTTGAATLSWDASPDARTIGYRVYWGTAPGTYSQTWGFGALSMQPTYTATLAGGRTYYFAVTAISDGSESGPSNEVSKALP